MPATATPELTIPPAIGPCIEYEGRRNTNGYGVVTWSAVSLLVRVSFAAIGRRFGIHPSTASRIARGLWRTEVAS